MTTPLSVFITTFNNERTLATCLETVKWADEIVVLDSFSQDQTPEIAQHYGCKFFQHTFLGYGPQKQMALEHTQHNWVLLLDADEFLSPEAEIEIQTLLKSGPSANGYTLPRIEQMFWQFAHPKTRHNHFLRLFDKRKGHVSDMPIHAAPKVSGKTEALQSGFYHLGEINIHTKVEKMNGYSTGLMDYKHQKGKKGSLWIMLLYPPLFFIRQYIFKRHFLNGMAGFIHSVVASFYVFLKYAKLNEKAQFDQYQNTLITQKLPDSKTKLN